MAATKTLTHDIKVRVSEATFAEVKARATDGMSAWLRALIERELATPTSSPQEAAPDTTAMPLEAQQAAALRAFNAATVVAHFARCTNGIDRRDLGTTQLHQDATEAAVLAAGGWSALCLAFPDPAAPEAGLFRDARRGGGADRLSNQRALRTSFTDRFCSHAASRESDAGWGEPPPWVPALSTLGRSLTFAESQAKVLSEPVAVKSMHGVLHTAGFGGDVGDRRSDLGCRLVWWARMRWRLDYQRVEERLAEVLAC